MRKNCSSDQEKLLKFEAEGREFSKFLRSLEQCFLTVGQNDFDNKIPNANELSKIVPLYSRNCLYVVHQQEIKVFCFN